jgi:hypothetical protein
MRAMDLAVFIIMIEMSIGFLGGMHFYTNEAGEDVDYMQSGLAQGGYVERFQTENISETYAEKPGIADYFKFALDWVFASFNMILMLVGAFFVIGALLNIQFGLPLYLCVFIQGIVYLIYAWGFIQWRSGRGGQAFE